MHGRVSKNPVQADPPQELAENKLPSLALSRSQFIREVEQTLKLSELIVEDALALEEQAVRSGSVRLQSEVCSLSAGLSCARWWVMVSESSKILLPFLFCAPM
jgi:hypothetical protein